MTEDLPKSLRFATSRLCVSRSSTMYAFCGRALQHPDNRVTSLYILQKRNLIQQKTISPNHTSVNSLVSPFPPIIWSGSGAGPRGAVS
jgi:hypothetical protein